MNERAVIVCTELRGVFFGYTTKTTGDIIKLRRARNILYWPSEQHGFIGLATKGPVAGSRVGPAADAELRKVTCVISVLPEAVERWEAEPWK